MMRRMPLCPLMHGAAAWIAWQSLLGGGAVVLDSDRTSTRPPRSAWPRRPTPTW